MDAVHDLGGKQGFGPVDVDEPDEPFHADWEGRMWAISRLARAPDWTLDWWRHVRENQQPEEYLTRPYFDSWAMTFLVALVDSGVLTLDEVISGKATPGTPRHKHQDLDRAAVLRMVAATAQRFDHETRDPPRFQPGQTVHTKHWTTDGHTRLPAYARDSPAVIHAHHGAFDFPDDTARGIPTVQHLYSVRLRACDLWPEAAASQDHVFLDLWESYLDPA